MDMTPLKEQTYDGIDAKRNHSWRHAEEDIKSIAYDKGASMVGIATLKQFEGVLNPKKFLPDARAVITFGVHYVSLDPAYRGANRKVRRVSDLIRERLSRIELDVARYLESNGESIVVKSAMPSSKAAAVCGLGKMDEKGKVHTLNYDTRQFFSCAVTSALLKPDAYVEGWKPAVERKSGRRKELNPTTEITEFALELGADLVGVAPVQRFDEITAKLKEIVDEEFLKIDVRDAGRAFGPVVPKLRRYEDARILHLTDFLQDARSVIVIGLHYPYQNLDRATEKPAEAVGPYSHIQYQTLRELAHIAFDIVRYLDDMGYKAIITYDLCGAGSAVESPRGRQPDIFCNRFAALAAGLGDMGKNGVILTQEFGITQRFMSIVTDASLEPSPVYGGESICRDCDMNCIISLTYG